MSRALRGKKAWRKSKVCSNKLDKGSSASTSILPYEREIQKAVIEWADCVRYKKHPLSRYLHHSANGGSRHIAEACQFRDMGVQAGYPDLTLDIAKSGYHGMRIELKRGNLGSLSAKQKERIEILREEGYLVVVCASVDDAIKNINDYIEGLQAS